MQSIEGWVSLNLGMSTEFQERLFWSMVSVVIVWALRRVLLLIALRDATDPRVLFQWRKTTRYIAFTFVALIIGRIWFEGMRSLSTFLGLTSAGLAIALKDLLANLAGWAFIVWWKPFLVGDRIQIGKDSGDVIDQEVMQFTLMETGNWVNADQSTGRVLHVPNGLIFTLPLANFTKGFPYLWNEIPIVVTFESNWRKAKGIIGDIVLQHTEFIAKEAEKDIGNVVKKHMIYYTKFTPIVYTTVADIGVKLTVRYLTRPRGKRGIRQQIWEDILDKFGEADDIDFAYPTTRFYNNTAEGKVGARAQLS